MIEYDIAVIGGGPAGIMAAIACDSSKVILLEKNPSLGRKLLLTGGGRCNITNLKPIRKLLTYYNDKNFIKTSFYTFTNEMLLSLFRDYDLDFKVEDHDRVFPETYKSGDVLDVLEKCLSGVDVRCGYEVRSISEGFVINDEIKSSRLIIATGGMTYPHTGSDVKNYSLTSQPLTPVKYGLVPLITQCDLSAISGITLEDVTVSFKGVSVRGNVLITHFGLTGPAILDISNHISEYCDYDVLRGEVSVCESISVDLTPDLSHDNLHEIFTASGKVMISNILKKYLPNNFAKYFLDSLEISDVSVSHLKKASRNRIIQNLKSFTFTITGFKSDLSKVTVGGVDTKFINPKTLESKLVPDLYFAGEILNLHGPTGGYNLKLAFSTGFLAGLSASRL